MRSEGKSQFRQKSRLSFLFRFFFIVVASEDNFTRRGEEALRAALMPRIWDVDDGKGDDKDDG